MATSVSEDCCYGNECVSVCAAANDLQSPYTCPVRVIMCMSVYCSACLYTIVYVCKPKSSIKLLLIAILAKISLL